VLVLSRRKNEQLVIGEGDSQVIITLVDIRGDGKVRIGIDANRDTPVHRKEVYDAIQRERGSDNANG